MQDRITEQLVGAIEPELLQSMQQATNALKVRPEPSADALAPLWRTNARWRQEMTSLLAQAGLRSA